MHAAAVPFRASVAPRTRGLSARASRGAARARVVAPRAAGPEPIPASEAVARARADAPAKRKGFGETMAFGGWAPEVINGRVAQLAFVAGVGAELVTGETLPAQFHDHVAALTLASTLVALASFMPGVQAKRYTSEPASKGPFGPFTPGKEMLHGRLAMIGLAAAFFLESQTGHAFWIR